MADAIQNNRQVLDMVLIVRNDKTTVWQNSSYKLEKGELGIGYYDNGKVIVKIGAEDGSKTWAECKQVEDILEKDLILTYNFGRHTTSNGFVNAGGTGMTVSEWLEDALSVTEDPDITLPTASMTADFTVSDNGESGATISKINWYGTFTDGTYEYGSTETKDETDANKKKKANASATWVVKLGGTQIGTAEDGFYAQNMILGDEATTVTLSATATLVTDNVRTPLNNVGAETTGKVATFDNGETTWTNNNVTATKTGFRKMFVGCTGAELTSDVIRGLNLKNAEASTTAFEVTAPKNATRLVIAAPTNSKGYNYTLKKAEMMTMSYEDYTDQFSTDAQVAVADVRGGTNGLQNYNIYSYSFAALKVDTMFKITLKSAKN